MIITDKIIYAGYSTLADGSVKFRTAKTTARIAQLEAQGESVNMISIKPVTTKSAAAKELLARDYCKDDNAIVELFVGRARNDNPFKQGARVVRVRVPTRFAQELLGEQVEVVRPRGVLNRVYPEIRMTPSEAEAHREAFNKKARALA